MVYLILIVITVVLLWILRKFKVPKLGTLSLVTGAVKSGKTAFTLYLAVREYKKRRFIWLISSFFVCLLRRKPPEEPLFYSNIPLMGIKYVPITCDILMRNSRISYKSVVFISESSLVADQYAFNDEELRERSGLWNKLFGHMSRGGALFYETQSVKDNPFTLKNNISSYLSIHHKIRLPFFSILYVRELAYSSDENAGIRNNYDSDIEDSLQKIIMPNRIFKLYDSYSYSALTDDLPVEKTIKYYRVSKNRSILKLKKFVSFRHFKTIDN